jgi:RimJ/RimL family protein N-acetyltransferase
MINLYDDKVNLRLVEVKDSEFILSLRLDPQRANYLNATDASVEKQREWTRNYKQREAKNKEFYFVIEASGEALGTIRIYNIMDNNCYWGSWITKPNSPKGFGKRALILTLKFIFEELNKEETIFTVEQENENGKKLYLELGSTIINENSKEITFVLKKNDFYNVGIKRLS